ncbi:MAG: phospholipid carrier-dependent glycosyltransferase [Chloroflexi bacterium]|nr:phospholipid carrier-dependent glycosyltransferase [Chloroflexota bacterium]
MKLIRGEFAVRAIAGVAVFAVCLLVGGGHFHTIDEVSMFVTAANVVNRGELHTNQLGWAQWANRPGEEQGLLSESGDLYSKKSPAVIALMIPLAVIGRIIPSLGMIGGVLLLGPIRTALTAVLLFSTARDLGYNRAIAALATAAFALGTMALPYSRLAMGEPVASLGLVLSLWAWQKPTQLHTTVLCGAGLALAIGANAVYAGFVFIFAIALILPQWKSKSLREHASQLSLFALPIAAIGAALAAYNFARFGSVLQTGYHFAAGQEGFSTPLWWGALGLTISPARGLLWYSPPALLTLVAWPRFLLPITAPLLIVCLPLFESKTMRSRIGVGAILCAGFAVQIVGLATDFNIYEGELESQFPVDKSKPLLYHHDPSLVYDARRSPIVIHFQRVAASRPDIAWWPGGRQPTPIPEILSTIQTQQTADDALVYLVPEIIDPLVETANLPPTFGLPVNVRPDDALANRLFDRTRRDAIRVWMITWYGASDPGNWYEARLREHWASVSEQALDGYRVILFARPPMESVTVPADATFGSLRLIAYATDIDSATLFVELHWGATELPAGDYTAFVHVVGADGALIAGQDRQPLGGYRRTSMWRLGETVVDRFAFALAPDQLDDAHVEVGWYSWPSLQRLPLTDSSGSRVETDSLTLPINR